MLRDKQYNVLKWVALIALPALATFYTMVAGVWGLPYAQEIPDTIVALDMFLGALLGISTYKYNKER